MRIIPITFHVPSGRVTMATPSGRPAGEYLSEGISPAHGMDLKGPTVSLTSMARATCFLFWQLASCVSVSSRRTPPAAD